MRMTDGNAKMIGLVLVTHGHLAEEFRAALEHVVGPQEQIETIPIAPDDDMEGRRAAIVAAIERADSGAGVIVLTDMFGGTPSNLSISAMKPGRVDVIAGVNLPMLIKLASVRAAMPLPEAVAAASEAARRYIRAASRVLDPE